MIQAVKRRLAIRAYRKKLGPWLKQRYGPRPHYSPEQVRSGASTVDVDIDLVSDLLCLAYAMFCTRSDFNAHHAATGESCDYDAMRAEVSSTESSDSGSGAHGGDSGGSWLDSTGDSGGDSGGSDDGGSDD